jgi:F420-non-reducing hydrogenase small subunit
VLPALDIVYWPAVVDFKHDSLKARPNGDILVGFVEGSLRTKEDVENIKLMRDKCKIIIAFGSCACYGNVHGLANQWKKENLIKRKFFEAESIADESGKKPTKHVPEFTDKLVPTDAIIKVDAYLSGCPPRPEQIVAAIQFLLGQKPFPLKESPFCKDCVLNNQNCLLEKGILCFGSITSTGCSLKCTNEGKPCVGCYGPSKTVLTNRAEKLNSMTTRLDKISTGDKKSLYEFLALFLNVPLMAGFDLSTDILKQIKKKGAAQTPLTNIPATSTKIATNLLGFLKQHPDFHEISDVCDTCPRIRGRLKMTDVKRDYVGLPNQEDCFIEQGYICVGPVTRAGCGALCIRVNAPCTGCYGQTVWNVDQSSRYVDIVTKEFNVGLSKNELLKEVKDKLGTFEKFTLASNKTFKGGE